MTFYEIIKIEKGINDLTPGVVEKIGPVRLGFIQ